MSQINVIYLFNYFFHCIYLFFAKHGGIHLRTECGTRKRLAIPTKSPILKQQKHTQDEQGAMKPQKMALSKTMLSLW